MIINSEEIRNLYEAVVMCLEAWTDRGKSRSTWLSTENIRNEHLPSTSVDLYRYINLHHVLINHYSRISFLIFETKAAGAWSWQRISI